jgi:molecular chaperone DnaK
VRYRLGIDLGTTFTAAAVEEAGRAEVVQLGDHAPQIPSAVFVREDGTVLLGEAAVRKGAVQPERVEREFKRRLGDRIPYVLGGQEFTAEELTARLLRDVVDEVEKRFGRPERIALTHPANWGAHRRAVLLDAVRLAGIGEVTTLSEPAAAAVHYASTSLAEVGDVVAVYDLGGGTFDAAVLRKSPTEFELLGTPDGVEQLGGVDFDDKIFRYVLRSLGGLAADLDADQPAVVAALVRLRRECTEAKEALSKDGHTSVPVALPGMPATTVPLSRVEFEDMIRPDIEQTVRCMHRALESAALVPEAVRTVVLVGGSARIPLVAEALGHEFGRPVAVSTQPKLAVALGAALLAGGVLPAGPPAPPVTAGSPTPAGETLTGSGKTPSGSGKRPTVSGDRPGVLGGGPSHPRGRSPLKTLTPPGGSPASGRAPARRLLAAVAGLLVLALLAALVLPLALADPPPAAVRVEDQEAGPDDRYTADLTKPVTVTGLGGATRVSPRVLGIPLKGADVDGGAAEVDLMAFGQLLSGPIHVTATDGSDFDFVVETEADGFGNVVRWLPLLPMLFAFAYAESLLRGIRRRRAARRSDIAAMAGVGAVAGLALALASWTLGLRDIGFPVLVTVLALTAAAGGLLGLHQAVVARARAPKTQRPVGSP